MRSGDRIIVGRGMRLLGASNVRVDEGMLKLGVGRFPFSDARVPGRLRVRGRLLIQGSVAVAPGNWWDIGVGAEVRIGDGTFFNSGARLASTIGVCIGARCAISWDAQIVDDDFHPVIIGGEQKPRHQPVTIGDHVLIGASSKVLKGSIISDNSIVAAGAVVSGEFHEPGCLLAGVPARVIRRDAAWAW